MKNQDPLNPVDNSQVTSQMAQISTVTDQQPEQHGQPAVSQLQQSQAVQSTQLARHTVWCGQLADAGEHRASARARARPGPYGGSR